MLFAPSAPFGPCTSQRTAGTFCGDQALVRAALLGLQPWQSIAEPTIARFWPRLPSQHRCSGYFCSVTHPAPGDFEQYFWHRGLVCRVESGALLPRGNHICSRDVPGPSEALRCPNNLAARAIPASKPFFFWKTNPGVSLKCHIFPHTAPKTRAPRCPTPPRRAGGRQQLHSRVTGASSSGQPVSLSTLYWETTPCCALQFVASHL